ncbi:hypothetical protein F4781DRAFT_50200 [Annulohypoxylon bovei var. microspora]|nr:hypothetical protein F4781DRAFT_50200 [Annulohypoxylon bovei var. microspora]
MKRVDSMPPSLSTHPSLDPLLLESAPNPARWKGIRSTGGWISHQWKQTIEEALEDLRSRRSWKPAFFYLYLGWIILLLVAIGLLASSPNVTSLYTSVVKTACQPDGSFSPYAESYNAWDWSSSGFFEITLVFGTLSFTVAKVIDICWDVIIGRVGQATLAMFSWHVFSQYTTTSMDKSPVTYRTFWVIFLHKEPTFFSIINLMRDFISYRRLHSVVAMLFMIVTMAFILIFPTLASAMTGYTPVNKAFIQGKSGNLIPFSDFKAVAYVVHDGDRINLTSDAYITRSLNPYYADPIIWGGNGWVSYHGCTSGGCDLLSSVSDYVSSYGFYGTNNTKSIWQGTKKLPAPTLNISAYYIPPGDLFGNGWIDTSSGQKPFQNETNLTYVASNRTYDLSYISSNGSCQPVLNEYQWGFSFAQLFILSILLSIWTFGISTMWLRAHFKLPLRGHPETPRGWKAVTLLADNMNMELPEADIDIHTLRDTEVRKKIKEHLGGGSVRFDAPLTRKEYSLRTGFYTWIKNNTLGKQIYRNKWWIAALLLAAVPYTPLLLYGLYVLPIGFFLMVISSCTILGVLFALGIGSTTRSRFFVTSLWIIAGLVVFISVCASGVLEKYQD